MVVSKFRSRKQLNAQKGGAPYPTLDNDPLFQELLQSPTPTLPQIKEYLNSLNTIPFNQYEVYKSLLTVERWLPILKRIFKQKNIPLINAYFEKRHHNFEISENIQIAALYRDYMPVAFFRRDLYHLYKFKESIKQDYQMIYPQWESFVIQCFKRYAYIPFLKTLIQKGWLIHPLIFFKHIHRIQNKTTKDSLVKDYFNTIHRRAPPLPTLPDNEEEDAWDIYNIEMDDWKMKHYNTMSDYRFVKNQSFVVELLEKAEKDPLAKKFLIQMVQAIDDTDIADIQENNFVQQTVYENLAAFKFYSKTEKYLEDLSNTIWKQLDESLNEEQYRLFITNAFIVYIETQNGSEEQYNIHKILLDRLLVKLNIDIQTLEIALPFNEPLPSVSVLGYALYFKNIPAIAYALDKNIKLSEGETQFFSGEEYVRLLDLPKFTSIIQSQYRQRIYKYGHPFQQKLMDQYHQHLEEYNKQIKGLKESLQSARSKGGSLKRRVRR